MGSSGRCMVRTRLGQLFEYLLASDSVLGSLVDSPLDDLANLSQWVHFAFVCACSRSYGASGFVILIWPLIDLGTFT